MGVKPGNEILLSKEYLKNLAWFRENRSKLSKYEGNWVLIHNGSVVAFSPNPNDIKEIVNKNGLDIEECFIHFLVNSNCIF